MRNCQPCCFAGTAPELQSCIKYLTTFLVVIFEKGLTSYQLRDFQCNFKATFRPRTNEAFHSFFPASIHFYNKLPISTRESTNICVFRRKILTTIILNYIHSTFLYCFKHLYCSMHPFCIIHPYFYLLLFSQVLLILSYCVVPLY